MFDFSNVLIWWFTILIISLTVLPATTNLFKKFRDKGYIFSKVLGILITSYLIWALGSLHILPFTKISIVLILIFITLVNLVVFGKKNRDENLKVSLKWAIFEEIIFLGGESAPDTKTAF